MHGKTPDQFTSAERYTLRSAACDIELASDLLTESEALAEARMTVEQSKALGEIQDRLKALMKSLRENGLVEVTA